MIRINLLGVPKPKKGKRATVASVPSVGGGEGPNPVILMILVVAIGLGGNGWYYLKLQKDAAKIAEDKAAADRENLRLSQVKVAFDAAEKQKEIYRQRVEVIDKLRSAQSGPVDLLNTIGDTVNSTEAVWLQSMKDNGNNIDIVGTGVGANSVANLITNLRKTGYFKNVEIKETYQDDSVKGVDAFQFTLTCEKGEKKQDKKS